VEINTNITTKVIIILYHTTKPTDLGKKGQRKQFKVKTQHGTYTQKEKY
jgi:hypothetical protein